MKFFVSLLIGLFGVVAAPARAQSDNPDMTVEVLGVYFTPPANAVAAIIKAIDASEREILVQAYGFTHNGIAQALVRAHQRGVLVRVLLDKKSASSNRYVISVLQQAQIDVRQDGKHAIAHDNRNLT
jgi:phosphatidylserine/phosphatidylglycerophosphate/cardiolipin synthase-like enzyme